MSHSWSLLSSSLDAALFCSPYILNHRPISLFHVVPKLCRKFTSSSPATSNLLGPVKSLTFPSPSHCPELFLWALIDILNLLQLEQKAVIRMVFPTESDDPTIMAVCSCLTSSFLYLLDMEPHQYTYSLLPCFFNM